MDQLLLPEDFILEQVKAKQRQHVVSRIYQYIIRRRVVQYVPDFLKGFFFTMEIFHQEVKSTERELFQFPDQPIFLHRHPMLKLQL